MPCFWAADFETTTTGKSDQERTEVWAAALCELWKDEARVYTSLDDWYYAIAAEEGNQFVYFHNLKFDGSFIVDWLLKHSFELAYDGERYLKPQEMGPCSFKVSISDKNVWYQLVIKTEYGNVIYIRDSYKRLPRSLRDLAKDLETPHQKLDMEYIGDRRAGGSITESEMSYIKNDVLALKELLEKTLTKKPKLTIGSECLSEYKKTINFRLFFPDLTEQAAGDTGLSQHEYCLNGYKGGWCYIPKKENHVVAKGRVLDANSLYPSRMHSDSGCYYPYGKGEYYKGNVPSYVLNNPHYYYYIRFICRFELKPGRLPTVQIKGNPFYAYNEWQKTSDIYWDGRRYDFYYDENKVKKPAIVRFTMTGPDFEKFMDNYTTKELQIIDSLVFHASVGFFDDYIDKYNNMKILATNPTGRLLGKLYNNNLYGQFARTTDSSYKVPVLDGELVRYISMTENNKEVGYMPVGAAITSWARLHTITHAEKLGDDFLYSDTDSLHFLGDTPAGFDVDPKRLGAWKEERVFDEAFFCRQKTYIERCGEDYNLVCAGMGQRAKENFIDALTKTFRSGRKYEEDEEQFIKAGKEITDLKPGLVVPGNLKGKRVIGGTVLFRQPYEMKSVIFLR